MSYTDRCYKKRLTQDSTRNESALEGHRASTRLDHFLVSPVRPLVRSCFPSPYTYVIPSFARLPTAPLRLVSLYASFYQAMLGDRLDYFLMLPVRYLVQSCFPSPYTYVIPSFTRLPHRSSLSYLTLPLIRLLSFTHSLLRLPHLSPHSSLTVFTHRI